jgi:hypothetical protein
MSPVSAGLPDLECLTRRQTTTRTARALPQAMILDATLGGIDRQEGALAMLQDVRRDRDAAIRLPVSAAWPDTPWGRQEDARRPERGLAFYDPRRAPPTAPGSRLRNRVADGGLEQADPVLDSALRGQQVLADLET